MDDKIKGILEEVQILFDCANQSSSLSRREAIIVGEAVAMPSRLKIKELREEQLPDSKDISFVKGWQKNETDQDDIINSVIAKWTLL